MEFNDLWKKYSKPSWNFDGSASDNILNYAEAKRLYSEVIQQTANGKQLETVSNIKPFIVKCEDGSTLCEWITKNWRMGISIEKDVNESSWYFVHKDPNIMEGGMITKEVIELIKVASF